MRDKIHIEHVEKWANFVKINPDWKKHHTEFINAQFEMAEMFMKRLLKENDGREKVMKLYGIKNVEGYKELLG